jgi:hypothetical protein
MLKKLNLMINIKREVFLRLSKLMDSHVLMCYCDICISLARLTDGDYEHEFLLSEGPKIRKRKKTEPAAQYLGNDISGYYKSNITSFNETHIEYVKFTPTQRVFLQNMFKECSSVGKRDRNVHRIDFILKHLINIGYKNQQITRKAIVAWFKNERFRGRRRANRKPVIRTRA